MLEKLYLFAKYLLSFRKSAWSLGNYPLRWRHDPAIEGTMPLWTGGDDAPEDGMPVAHPWTVQILNWYWMVGFGATKEEAYSELKEKFQSYLERGEPLPRPGTRVPIRFASTAKIDLYEQLARDFFEQVLDMDYDNLMFVSDQSSVHHFPAEGDVLEKIRQVYGVDVSDVEDGNLANILERISDTRLGIR